MKTNSKLTYKKSGVDIREGERFVDMIAPLARKTFRPEVLTDIGSFGALFRLNTKKYKDPVLVSGTDGVGTKLKIAFMTGRHDTVGIDLVAMCVNDILTCGAEPLFFLDYLATGKLRARNATAIIRGIAEGCAEAGCSLIGGETAEMPGFYEPGEYDLSGFAVGVVDRKAVIDGSLITEGDALIGLASSGIHSNGYSLVRKVFFEAGGMGIRKVIRELGVSLGEELLRPTRIYVKALNAVRGKIAVKGIAHITGGGIPGNLPRIFPGGIGAVLFEGSWPEQPVFGMIRRLGRVPERDMRRTFNLGIGLVIVVPDREKTRTVSLLKRRGFPAYLIGRTERGTGGVRYAKD